MMAVFHLIHVSQVIFPNNGTNDVSMSNGAKIYYYQQVAYNERFYAYSPTVTVPAFTFPKRLRSLQCGQSTSQLFVDYRPCIGSDFVSDNLKYRSPIMLVSLMPGR
jgi:hypothetical protein